MGVSAREALAPRASTNAELSSLLNYRRPEDTIGTISGFFGPKMVPMLCSQHLEVGLALHKVLGPGPQLITGGDFARIQNSEKQCYTI